MQAMLALAVSGLVASVAAEATAAAGRPNIIVVLLDDQGWTGTSVQMDPNIPSSKSDYYETPNLETLAAEGMRFSNAYAGGPMCSPSRVALFTGRSPAQMHMTDVAAGINVDGQYLTFSTGKPLVPPLPDGLLPETTTIAEHMKQFAPDYKSALVHKSHVGSYPTHYGFDAYDFHMRGYEPEGEDPKRVFSTANYANAFMETQVAEDNPFFMIVATSAAHLPFEGRAATYNRFLNKARGARHRSAEIATMTYDFDEALGMMLDKVDDLGIADNTYIIYTSDNGASNAPRNNEPLTLGKGTLWEGGIRVPMIVKGPGITPGSVSNVPIIGTDIFATVSDLLNISEPPAPGLESASFAPVLHNGGQLPAGSALSRAFGPNGELFFHFPHYTDVSKPMSAVRDGDYKLVRLYGEHGAADQHGLFNIAANPSEADFAAAQTLAEQMPERTSAMLGKLDAWLEGVEAPRAYAYDEHVELLWDASAPGTRPSLWRSRIAASGLRRESWNIIPDHYLPTPYSDAMQAKQSAANNFQPGLSSSAFAFDGNDLIAGPFFRVSDANPTDVLDKDHSSSFELWVRLDDLATNKILFESGGATAGVSITVGDGDGNGSFNDVRARVLGNNGQQLTATGPLNRFADPTTDFVQISAVVSDSNSDRYLELYVNGALLARVEGVAGDAGRLNWDSFDPAGLGMAGGLSVGAAAGAGPLPFIGPLRGQISRMRFLDQAITPNAVLANYNGALHPTAFGIQSAAGDAAVPTTRPGRVALGGAESTFLLAMHERTHRLAADMPLDAVVAGDLTLNEANPTAPGSLPAASAFSSYLLNLDPLGGDGATSATAAGSLEFSYDIVGLLLSGGGLAASDATLGSIGDYGSAADRGVQLSGDDFLTVSPDRRTLTFSLTVAGDQMNQLRVLTEAPLGGDFDGDGEVSGADLAQWKTAQGLTGAGDADGDGDSDGGDYLVWQRNLGRLAGATGSAAQVPEPAATFLVFASVAMAGLARRRVGVRGG